jgi:hypothetical protein
MLQIWTPLPIGATGIVASIYWRSAGIPILNSSADFLSPLCRVLPIRQDITYWFCFTGAKTEIHTIKDDSKINREKNIDRRSQRHIVNVWHLSDPPSFSLPTTFKGQERVNPRCRESYLLLSCACWEGLGLLLLVNLHNNSSEVFIKVWSIWKILSFL